MPNVHVTPIVGLPQFSGWSHVIEGTHSSPHRFVAVLAVSGRQASNIGRDVAELLLAHTINTAEELYTVVSGAVELSAKAECQLDIAAALISDSRTVFIAKHASVFLRRGSKIGVILQSLDKLKVIEGKRIQDDVCVLATQQAGEFLGEIELKSKQGYDVDTIITSIVPGVHAQVDSSLSAFAFINEADTPEDFPSSSTVQSWAVEPEGALPQNAIPNTDVAETEHVTSLAGGQKMTNTQVILTKASAAISSFAVFVWESTRSFLIWFWLLIRWLTAHLKKILSKESGVALSGATDSAVESSYVSPVQQRRKKILVGIACFLVVAVLLAVVFWVQRRNSELAAARSLVAPLQVELTTAQVLVESEPVAARTQVQEIIQDLEVLEAEHASKPRMEAVFVEERMRAQYIFDSISGQEALESLPVFYDLRLVKSDFVSKYVAQVGEYAVFLDVEQKQIIALHLGDKKPQLISVDGLGEVRAMSAASDRVLLLNSGIHALRLQADSTPETLKAEGDSTRGGTLIGSFDRFVYVFNPVKRNLYRYAEQEAGYSDPIGWLQISKGVEYSSVLSMAIDGDIWLGSVDGSIRKFTSGVEQDFVVSGLPEAFSSEIFLVTDATMKNLYVLEPAKHRLVILSKDGTFLRELSNQSLGAVNGLVVQESLEKAFAVSGATVFEVSI